MPDPPHHPGSAFPDPPKGPLTLSAPTVRTRLARAGTRAVRAPRVADTPNSRAEGPPSGPGHHDPGPPDGRRARLSHAGPGTGRADRRTPAGPHDAPRRPRRPLRARPPCASATALPTTRLTRPPYPAARRNTVVRTRVADDHRAQASQADGPGPRHGRPDGRTAGRTHRTDGRTGRPERGRRTEDEGQGDQRTGGRRAHRAPSAERLPPDRLSRTDPPPPHRTPSLGPQTLTEPRGPSLEPRASGSPEPPTLTGPGDQPPPGAPRSRDAPEGTASDTTAEPSPPAPTPTPLPTPPRLRLQLRPRRPNRTYATNAPPCTPPQTPPRDAPHPPELTTI